MTETYKKFTRTLIQDPDDPESVILDLGWPLCQEMGWQEGDTLQWTDNGDGSWTLSKKPT